MVQTWLPNSKPKEQPISRLTVDVHGVRGSSFLLREQHISKDCRRPRCQRIEFVCVSAGMHAAHYEGHDEPVTDLNPRSPSPARSASPEFDYDYGQFSDQDTPTGTHGRQPASPDTRAGAAWGGRASPNASAAAQVQLDATLAQSLRDMEEEEHPDFIQVQDD